METIIRYTTPTITYRFKVVRPEDISVAYLTIKQGEQTLIEKDLSSATIGTDTLSWTLTQTETMLMGTSAVQVMLNWKTAFGLRGASRKTQILMDTNYKDEVI